MEFRSFSLKSYSLSLLGNDLVLLWIPYKNKNEIFKIRKKLIARSNEENILENKIIHTTLFYFKNLNIEEKREIEEKIKKINRIINKNPLTIKIEKIGLWKDEIDIKKFKKSFNLYDNMKCNLILEKNAKHFFNFMI